MNDVFAEVKEPHKRHIVKMISDHILFNNINISKNNLVKYCPDHKLDEDDWFKIENFNQQEFCLSFLQDDFDSKSCNALTKEQFTNITYVFSIQENDFFFQKITPSLFLKKKIISFGETVSIGKEQCRLVINSVPDAIYRRDDNVLIFKNLSTITSIFNNIDTLYKEATNEQVKHFFTESFVTISNDYDIEKVSKPNRKRIALVLETLKSMSDKEKTKMLSYINNYCEEKLPFNHNENTFTISSENELKQLLYGIEQRFYTTPFSNEKRLANSIQKLS